MYQLFQMDSRVNVSTQRHASWGNISRGLEHALDTVVGFYQAHNQSVKTDHILTKVIAPFGAGDQYSVRDFYMRVMDEALSVARTLKLTSVVQAGIAHRGQFYGAGVHEVLLATDTAFDYEHLHTNWEKAKAVRVLSHPVTNLGLDIPDGLNRSGDAGIAVIEIHIPKLLIQYHAFRKNEATRKAVLGFPERSTYQFIHRFVLPNMMEDHLNHVLVNRVRDSLFEEPVNDKRPSHSFHIPNWSDGVEKFHSQLKDYLLDKTLSAKAIMEAIPLVKGSTVHGYSTLPRVQRTQQVKWALALARLDLLEIIVHASTHSKGNPNRSELNAIKREIERYRIDRTFKQVMPREIYNATMFRWDRLETMIG